MWLFWKSNSFWVKWIQILTNLITYLCATTGYFKFFENNSIFKIDHRSIQKIWHKQSATWAWVHTHTHTHIYIYIYWERWSFYCVNTVSAALGDSVSRPCDDQTKGNPCWGYPYIYCPVRHDEKIIYFLGYCGKGYLVHLNFVTCSLM